MVRQCLASAQSAGDTSETPASYPRDPVLNSIAHGANRHAVLTSYRSETVDCPLTVLDIIPLPVAIVKTRQRCRRTLRRGRLYANMDKLLVPRDTLLTIRSTDRCIMKPIALANIFPTGQPQHTKSSVVHPKPAPDYIASRDASRSKFRRAFDHISHGVAHICKAMKYGVPGIDLNKEVCWHKGCSNNPTYIWRLYESVPI